MYHKLIGSVCTLAAAALFPLVGFSQVAAKLAQTPDPGKPLMTLETSCGECSYGMEGTGCDVAVRLPEGTFYVDGVGISEFGNPHGEHGYCLALRKAEVQGEVVDGRFKATYYKLLPVDQSEQKEKGDSRKEKKKH